jgi:hypothetical protein
MVVVILLVLSVTAQKNDNDKEIDQITETLTHYIEGTAIGDPDRLRMAFHPDFNLYTITETDSLRIRSGENYIAAVVDGKKYNRIGRIILIDYENDAAIAKAEIIVPDQRIYTDYFLLLKYNGAWKIIHKSYTSKPFPGDK